MPAHTSLERFLCAWTLEITLDHLPEPATRYEQSTCWKRPSCQLAPMCKYPHCSACSLPDIHSTTRIGLL